MELQNYDELYSNCDLQVEQIKRGAVNWHLQCEILKHEELIALIEKTQLQELKENKTVSAEVSQEYIDKYVYVIEVLKKLQTSIDTIK
jgi:molybdopterin-binding protein